MKTTFLLFKPTIKKTTRPIAAIIEITYHTILPVVITYFILKYNIPILFALLLLPILIRFKTEQE